jgi:hypothetical protein
VVALCSDTEGMGKKILHMIFFPIPFVQDTGRWWLGRKKKKNRKIAKWTFRGIFGFTVFV